MRADENAEAEKKATSLYPLQEAETAVREHEQIDEKADERAGKNRTLAHLQNVLKKPAHTQHKA